MVNRAVSPSRTVRTWITVTVVVALAAGFALGLRGPHSPSVDSMVNLVGGLVLAASGGFMFWKARVPGSTRAEEAARAPFRVIAACQTLLGLSFLVPDVRVQAVVLVVILAPMIVACVRLRRAMKMMKRT
jgi:arginine exporter protein ArgO